MGIIKTTIKWITIIIVALFSCAIIAAFVFGTGPNETATNSIEIEDGGVETSAYGDEKSLPETPASNAIQAGTYKVGSDIQPGLYKVIVKDSFTDMGYIDRSKDAKMEFESIIANGIIFNSGYVRIKESDAYVKIQGATLYPEDTIEINIRNVFEDGIYLVDVDIAPGTYKVEVTDTTTNMGYVERQSDVSMEFGDIIANEIFQGQGYVEIMSSDFSIKIQGATLTKV